MGENLKKIGNTLLFAREEQGVIVADVAAKLRISESYLHALECGDIAQLPEPVYTEAYIMGYAKVLDIPSEPLISLYREDNDKLTQTPAICFSKLELQLQHIGGIRSQHQNTSRMLWLAGVMVIIALLAWYNQGSLYQSLKEELFPTAQKSSAPALKVSQTDDLTEKKNLAQNTVGQNTRPPNN